MHAGADAAGDRLPAGLSRLRLIFILAAVAALGPLSIDMYLPSLPALQHYFATDATTTQLTLAAYFVGLALGQIFYGPIADGLGRKPPLLFGLGLYTLASLACLFAASMTQLIGLRLLQALGGCAGMVVSRAIVRDCFGESSMARVLSLLLLIMGVAPVLAPLLGGVLFEHFSWRAIFLVLTLYGGLCFTLIAMGIPETLHGPRHRPSLAHALQAYRKLIRHRRFMGYALAGSVAQAGMFVYISASSFVFIEVYHLTPSQYAALFGLNAFGLICASQLNSRALDRVPAQHLLRRALRSNASAGLLMVLAVYLTQSPLWLIVPLFFCVASLGFSFPNSTAAAMAPFGDRAGAASALLGTLQFVIASLSSSLAARLYDGSARPMALVIAGCGLCALLLLRVLAPPLPQPTSASQ